MKKMLAKKKMGMHVWDIVPGYLARKGKDLV
jgi:hypothetical protein